MEDVFRLRLRIRPLFNWKISGAVLPIIWGAGLAMALGGVTYTNHTFVLFGVWGVLFWLTTDRSFALRRVMQKCRGRHNRILFLESRRRYLTWELKGISVFVLISVTSMVAATHYLKTHEQEDTFDKLTVAVTFLPGAESNPLQSRFTFHNGGHVGLSTHRLVCYSAMAVGNFGLTTSSGPSMMVDGHAVIGYDVMDEITNQ